MSSTSGTRSSTNGLAVAGLVCGVVGIFIANLILGPLAIIFGAVGLKRPGGTGMAKAAIILGIVDIVLFFVVMLAFSSGGGFSWRIGG
ncbi:hypothetical protein GCM10010329_60320 [Streptomyces spiroverticillatus]|uniref:DUF4190 domain-containing protein n=1 Tax=Streptomyces finlayi TaxID=67296 RepID=A0A918X4L2_9ACTN|nr:DUF4190 domain-containing protein [Streptomyces finlayi]GHA28969.1 hypothetical protein GCM10010329_60320 [Streptomyces spiroverticillatus]GHD09545.1 hypothetical protein GCM10010334_63980 [Streptomyces finlayi]